MPDIPDMPDVGQQLFIMREYIQANNLAVPLLLLFITMIILIVKYVDYTNTLTHEQEIAHNKKFGLGVSVVLLSILLSYQQYSIMQGMILLIGFYRIVLRTQKYKKLRDFLYKLF